MTNFRVKIGGFLLGSDLKEKFDDFKPFTSDFKPANADFKIYAGLYYHSNNLWSPEVPDVKSPEIMTSKHTLFELKVGDWRVQFSYAGRHGEEFTVVRKPLFY